MLVSCKYLHNRRLEISSQTGRESVISKLFSLLCVYKCWSIQVSKLMHEGHTLHERILTCVCFFWSAFLLVPMYGCLCLCMWMHVHPGSLIWNWIQLAAFRGSEEGEILPQLLINSGPGPQCAAPIHRLARGSWRKAVVLVFGQHNQVCGCESDLLART